MSSPPRIRVALIGLSSSALTAWAPRAHLPYLLSPRGRAKYEIVALLNSSEAAARAAVEAFDLPAATTRTYGDPAALAADKDVDLVVCTTRVDKHYQTTLDSVKAGKDAFVEWPLAQDAAHAAELAEAASKAGGKTVVGLQGLKAPLAVKVRELLEEGRIGKVLSSELRSFGGSNHRSKLPLTYFAERAVGGNVYTIGVGHTIDLVQSVIGELASATGDFHLQRPDLVAPDSSIVRSDVPDLILVTGKWDESKVTQKNATLHYRLRRGQPFPGEPALVWSINGERGEIRVVSEQNSFISLNQEPPIIEIHDFETDKVDKVEWAWADWQKDLPVTARNIGAVYEAFADAKTGGDTGQYRTFDDAARRHKQLDSLLAEWHA